PTYHSRFPTPLYQLGHYQIHVSRLAKTENKQTQSRQSNGYEKSELNTSREIDTNISEIRKVNNANCAERCESVQPRRSP
ncbi:hypothetical protein J6590_033016, partial [Homalodisca vitripennis]